MNIEQFSWNVAEYEGKRVKSYLFVSPNDLFLSLFLRFKQRYLNLRDDSILRQPRLTITSEEVVEMESDRFGVIRCGRDSGKSRASCEPNRVQIRDRSKSHALLAQIGYRR